MPARTGHPPDSGHDALYYFIYLIQAAFDDLVKFQVHVRGVEFALTYTLHRRGPHLLVESHTLLTERRCCQPYADRVARKTRLASYGELAAAGPGGLHLASMSDFGPKGKKLAVAAAAERRMPLIDVFFSPVETMDFLASNPRFLSA